MPFATFKTVREVSSEDSVHSAKQLLSQQPGKKWRTKDVGEKQAYVILELDEPHKITGIDIGNEHSAFVEVLVGNAGCAPSDFTEILITCSFMTPTESKNSTTTNRVRCFSQEALVSTTIDSKWKLVKVICTQPFNKHTQYGLSFIKVHVAESEVAKKVTPAASNLVPEKFLLRRSSGTDKQPTTRANAFGMGKFALREDSPDSESESTSSLFNRWKTSRNSSGGDNAPTAAAAIREASSPAALRRLSNSVVTPKPIKASAFVSTNEEPEEPKEKKEILDRNRDRLLFGDDDEDDAMTGRGAKNQRLAKQIEVDKERLSEQQLKQKGSHKRTSIGNETTRPKDKASTTLPKSTDTGSSSTKPVNTPERATKRNSSPTTNRQPAKKIKTLSTTTKYRPFNQLLRGVVLVISGIQNPDRANLRSKAVALGARYKADWEQGCTHLICAFKNTPKYQQVQGKGKIVTRSWIEKCYTLKKYLPWRRYALESSELAKNESDEELVDESMKPKAIEIDGEDDAEAPTISHAKPLTDDKNHTLAMYDLGDVDERSEVHNVTSGSDTEDEIERVIKQKNSSPKTNQNNNKENATLNKSNRDRDVYEVTTEEEDYLKDKLQMRQDFFKKCKFFICSDVSVVDKIKLEKFIDKYAGQLTQLADAHYAISDRTLDKSQTFSGEIVRPLWIFECNDMENKVPTARYLV